MVSAQDHFLAGFRVNRDFTNSLEVVFNRLTISFVRLSTVFFFPSPFVDVLFVYALEYAVITFNFSSYFLLSASISCVTFV